jgi:hypothetical protein
MSSIPDPDAVVLDRHPKPVTGCRRHRYFHRSAVIVEFHRIGEQVVEHLLEPLWIERNSIQAGIGDYSDLNSIFPGKGIDDGADFRHGLVHPESPRREFHAAGFDFWTGRARH